MKKETESSVKTASKPKGNKKKTSVKKKMYLTFEKGPG